jgi:ABC-type transport system involved in multi-copper enzyme maturation permease subunit
MQLLQQRLGFKITATVLFLVMLGSYFLPATIESYRIDRLEQSIKDILSGSNRESGEGPAVEFAEEGSVTINGVTYADPRLVSIADSFFNESGDLVAAAEAAVFLVASEMPDWIPTFLLEQPQLTLGVWVVASLWLVLVVWSGMTWSFLLSLTLMFLLSIPFWIGSLFYGRLDSPTNTSAILAICGMGFLGVTFALLTQVALFVLSAPVPVVAVAQELVREAVRQRISVAFIVMLVILLPLIPLWIDQDEQLRYQLQAYLSRSISITYVLLACMTLILGCASVAFEIRDRQIWQVMTKPVSRWSYLLGKWLGLITINAVGITTASLAIFISVEYMKTRPAMDATDELAVRTEVLTARAGITPVYPVIGPTRLRELVMQKIDDESVLREQIESGQRTELEIQAELSGQIVKEFRLDQRKVAPGAGKIVRFEGLQRTRELGGEAKLQYLFHCGASSTHEVHPLIFRFPMDSSWVVIQYVPTVGASMRIPPQMINEDGVLEIEILNAGFDEASEQFYPAGWSVNWDLDKLEVLYEVSGFEGNFLRAMLVDWFKLSFLGVLAVVTASFLSFPVACLFSFAIFIGGSIAPFLGLSLDQYTPTNIVEEAISWVAYMVHVLLYRFGAVKPSQMLVEGRLISWSEVMLEFIWLMVIWAGISMFLGFIAFRKKELAIYSGQG